LRAHQRRNLRTVAVERELARTKEKDGDEVSGDCCCGH